MLRDDLRRKLAERVTLHQESGVQRVMRHPVRMATVRGSRYLGAVTGRAIPATARTFWGDEMQVRLPESLSCQLVAYGYFEENLSAILIGELAPGDVVFDVGAHFGYFTRLASQIVGPGGRVHSFEPTPSTFGVLQRNAAGLANVTLNRAAVWSERATLTFNDYGPANSMFNSLFAARGGDGGMPATARTHEVDAVALDDYAAEHGMPAFVKVDAESAEGHVLDGMTRILEQGRPAITLEVGDLDVAGAPSSRSLLERVIAAGYAPHEYRDGRVRPHELRDRYDYDNILLKAV